MLAGLLSIAIFFPAEPTKPDSELRKFATRYLADSVKFDHFSGVAIVARNGKPIWSKAVGTDRGKPISLSSQFRIGSVSKQFVAVGILKLAQEGKLSLDDSVRSSLPNTPESWQQIKIRHLLDHTSGLVNFTALPEASGEFLKTSHPTSEVIKIIANHPLQSSPGAEFQYNNSGYFLLGLVIEAVSKQSLSMFFDTQFFAPLKMNSTFDESRMARDHRVVQSFSVDDGKFRPTEFVDMRNLFAMGGLVSSANDLLTWENALLSGKVIEAKWMTKMLTPGIGLFGFGWVIDQLGSLTRYYHDGGVTDFSTSVQYFPGSKITIVAISNRGDDGGIRVAYDIAGWYADIPATIRSIQQALLTRSAESSLKLISKCQKRFPNFDISESKVRELGNYMVISKNKPQALQLYMLNTKIYPESADAHYRLALSYSWKGEKNPAMKELEKALALDPTHKQAIELKKTFVQR